MGSAGAAGTLDHMEHKRRGAGARSNLQEHAKRRFEHSAVEHHAGIRDHARISVADGQRVAGAICFSDSGSRAHGRSAGLQARVSDRIKRRLALFASFLF